MNHLKEVSLSQPKYYFLYDKKMSAEVEIILVKHVANQCVNIVFGQFLVKNGSTSFKLCSLVGFRMLLLLVGFIEGRDVLRERCFSL